MNHEDELISQIHEARRKIFLEDCGGDPRRLYEYFKRLEAEHPDKVVGYERPGTSRRPPA